MHTKNFVPDGSRMFQKNLHCTEGSEMGEKTKEKIM
jgi:hypothetical protein